MSFIHFRNLCLAFPQSEESPHFEKISFKCKNKIFATYDSKLNSANIILNLEAQDLFTSISSGSIYPVQNKWGQKGWTTIDLNNCNPTLLIDILKHAYCTVAPSSYKNIILPTLNPSKEYISKNSVTIETAPLRVWKILTETEYIQQWDEIPDGNNIGPSLEMSSEIMWILPDGQYSKLTVTELDYQERLKLNLFVSHWPLGEPLYDISYTYILTKEYNSTILSLEIGDFSALTDSELYMTSSKHFAERALHAISQLALKQLTPNYK